MIKEKQPSRVALGRLAWAMTAVALLATLTLAISPPARAWAGELLRQIGPFRLIDAATPGRVAEPADAPLLPTAEPPSDVPEVELADNAAAAGALAGFGVLEPAELLGYRLDGEWAITPNGNGTVVVTAYRDPSGDHFLVLNQYRYGPGDQFDQSYGQNETVSNVMVNEVDGIAVTGRYMGRPDGSAPQDQPELLETNWVIWDVEGVAYSLYSDALTIEELTAVAESMK